MRIPVPAALALAAVLVLGLPTGARAGDDLADLAAATEEARTILQTERKLLVSQGMALSAGQSSAFWPVYDRYLLDLKAAGDLRVKVITDYAANYGNLSDDKARQLVGDYLAYQEKVLKIRKGYLRKFRKVLSEVELARLYQIENKLDAVTNFVLADQIPLVPDAPSPAPGR